MEINIHDLTRSELQFICKRNSISAKGTNVDLKNALASLPTVEGLDELLSLPEVTTKPKKRPTPVVTRSLAKKFKVPNFTEASETKNRTEPASVQLNEEVGKKNDETCSSQTEEVRTLKEIIQGLQDELAIAEARLTLDEASRARAETRILEEDALRKKLHNTILEPIGNIRVICRVCPPIPDDSAATAEVSPGGDDDDG